MRMDLALHFKKQCLAFLVRFYVHRLCTSVGREAPMETYCRLFSRFYDCSTPRLLSTHTEITHRQSDEDLTLDETGASTRDSSCVDLAT